MDVAGGLDLPSTLMVEFLKSNGQALLAQTTVDAWHAAQRGVQEAPEQEEIEEDW